MSDITKNTIDSLLQQARNHLEVTEERGNEQQSAWNKAEQVFLHSVEHQDWETAVEACDVMFQAEQEDSMVALGHGLWLAVTYPINPEISAVMLEHVVNNTPADSDGAAVAAATACYLVDMRLDPDSKAHHNLSFFTQQLLTKVAKRHSQVDDPEVFAFWVEKLELNNPDVFLPRLATVIDILVEDKWWIDRDTLRDQLPE